MHFAPFLLLLFFFFEFRPESTSLAPVQPESVCFGGFSQYEPIRPESAQIGAYRETKKKKKNWTRHQHAGNGVTRALSHRATSDASAMPILSHPCIIDDGATMGMLELYGCVFLVKFVSNKEAKEFK